MPLAVKENQRETVTIAYLKNIVYIMDNFKALIQVEIDVYIHVLEEDDAATTVEVTNSGNTHCYTEVKKKHHSGLSLGERALEQMLARSPLRRALAIKMVVRHRFQKTVTFLTVDKWQIMWENKPKPVIP